MKISDKLHETYEGYYEDNLNLEQKRAIAARQTIQHLLLMHPNKPLSFLDIGAGNGSLLSELDKINYTKNLNALEISASGLSAIENRNLKNLNSARQFDGYKIDSDDNSYELGAAVHVLEHVEHERIFLQEITRVCQTVYIEVPLELTLDIDKSIRMSRPYGHLNFYTPKTFRNLLETCDLEVLAHKVFANRLEYEQFVSGKFSGSIKHYIRSGFLACLPSIAPMFMTYLCGAICRRK